MQTFIDFLVNNYLWFIIISLILVFALIGYLVDTSERAGKARNMGDMPNLNGNSKGDVAPSLENVDAGTTSTEDNSSSATTTENK